MSGAQERSITNLRHQCETDGCYRDELWDWTPFNSCFGDSGIRISDIDGMVERNGLFLLLDGKRVGAKGETFISTGQRLLYQRFAETKAGTCVVFHGQPPLTVHKVRIWRPGGTLEGPQDCDLDGLKAIVTTWYEWANGMPAVKATRLETEIHVSDPLPIEVDGWPKVRQQGDGLPDRWEVA